VVYPSQVDVVEVVVVDMIYLYQSETEKETKQLAFQYGRYGVVLYACII